tara:strand:+ start:6442 stop:6642 length:201 start_codon:yes stop_codon:yes gene_type:complete
MVNLDEMRLNEVKIERIEECLKDNTLIGDMFDDIEGLKKELSRKDYQIQELQKDLKILSERLKEKE